MRIDQILPTINYGDAVSNYTINIKNILEEFGYKTDIYAENIGPKVSTKVKHISSYKKNNKTDIIIYHMSTGSKLSNFVEEIKGVKKVMFYHNITPSEYFKYYNKNIFDIVELGKKQLKVLSDTFNYTISDSEYNREELIQLGYKNNYVLPILISFDDYKKEPNSKILEKYDDEYINIIFVGRIAPNKKQEDVIKTFYYYKKFINKKSRLFLVGSYAGMEKYLNSLESLIRFLNLEDVHICGHASFSEILAYYRIADVFLCMSVHEGFCVPLVESMFFEIPIIAYDSTAIPYTLGNSGILIKDKNYIGVAALIDEVIKDKELNKKIIDKQNERLKDFSYESIKKNFEVYLKAIIGDQ